MKPNQKRTESESNPARFRIIKTKIAQLPASTQRRSAKLSPAKPAFLSFGFPLSLGISSFVILPRKKPRLSHRGTATYLQPMRARMTYLLALAFSCFFVSAAEPAKDTGTTKDLFNGKDLGGWKKTEFGGEGEVEVKDGKIITHQGASFSGVQYTNSVPTNHFQITLEAMKIEGDDFFCGLTFPVNDSHCSLILGGWGGGLVGLSSLDGMDASENDTTKYIKFDKNKWNKIKVEVRPERIRAWLDGDKIVDADIEDHKIDLRAGGIECKSRSDFAPIKRPRPGAISGSPAPRPKNLNPADISQRRGECNPSKRRSSRSWPI